jgi:hypothetical protein
LIIKGESVKRRKRRKRREVESGAREKSLSSCLLLTSRDFLLALAVGPMARKSRAERVDHIPGTAGNPSATEQHHHPGFPALPDPAF